MGNRGAECGRACHPATGETPRDHPLVCETSPGLTGRSHRRPFRGTLGAGTDNRYALRGIAWAALARRRSGRTDASVRHTLLRTQNGLHLTDRTSCLRMRLGDQSNRAICSAARSGLSSAPLDSPGYAFTICGILPPHCSCTKASIPKSSVNCSATVVSDSPWAHTATSSPICSNRP